LAGNWWFLVANIRFALKISAANSFRVVFLFFNMEEITQEILTQDLLVVSNRDSLNFETTLPAVNNGQSDLSITDSTVFPKQETETFFPIEKDKTGNTNQLTIESDTLTGKLFYYQQKIINT
jgi:hypothetical protein